MRVSDWSSDVCSSDLWNADAAHAGGPSIRIVSWPWSSSAFTHASDTAPRLPWAARGRSGCATVSGWSGWLQRGRSGRGARVPPRSGGRGASPFLEARALQRSEEHTSELQSLMRISYAVSCLKKKKERVSENIHNIYKQDKHHTSLT